MQSRKYVAIEFAFILGNLFFVLLFCLDRWGPHAFSLEGYQTYNAEKLIATLYLIAMLAFYAFRWLKPGEDIVSRLTLAHSSILATLLTLELLFFVAPSLAPSALAKLSPRFNTELQTLRANVLEYLPDSPWVKFKPLTAVRDLYADQDMEKGWLTDTLGFKNERDIASRPELVALAVGDSFTEGMGVAVDKTWTALLTRQGYPIYNLGVQAYAPVQLVGALEQFGDRFRVKLVIFGYTPGFESRNESFVRSKPGQGGFVYRGGVERIQSYLDEARLRETRFFPTMNALVDLTKSYFGGRFKDMKERLTASPCMARGEPALAVYCREITTAAKQVFDTHSIAWQMTTDALLRAKQLARQQGAEFVVLLYHHRGFIYYEKVVAPPWPSHYESVASNALKDFSRKNSIPVIDTYQPFAAYLQSLPRPLRIEKLPFFRHDGHMNEIGQRLVAETVLDYIESREHTTVIPTKTK